MANSPSVQADLLFSATTSSQTQFQGLANNALSRGIDSYLKGDMDSAIREFRRSIGLSPYSENSLKAYQLMADAYQQQDKPDEAVKVYQQAARLFPTSDTPHLELGNIYYGQGRYVDAENEYAQAVKLNPTISMNTYSLGQAYMAQERYSDALAQFTRVTQLNPRDPSGYLALGQVNRKMERFTDAVANLETAIQMNSNYADLHLELGMTYTDMKEMDKALEEVSILAGMDTASSVELQNYIHVASQPKMLIGFTLSSFNATMGPGSSISAMDADLTEPNSSKIYAMSFIFNKEMDPSSVQDINNWILSRADGSRPGGAYNWGLAVKPTEASISPLPISVIYHSDTLTADVMFRVSQNADGDATLDPSHVMFRFMGKDAYGNTMDTSSDEYSGISMIV